MGMVEYLETKATAKCMRVKVSQGINMHDELSPNI
jgi:hypothetical protein